MPTYEYQCDVCQYSFEQFQSIKQNPLKKCPECGGKVSRLIGAGAGFIFKGTGFHVTDYRSREYRREAKAQNETPTTKQKTISNASDGGKK